MIYIVTTAWNVSNIPSFFCSVFSCIQSRYIRTRKNFVFGHFACSGLLTLTHLKKRNTAWDTAFSDTYFFVFKKLQKIFLQKKLFLSYSMQSFHFTNDRRCSLSIKFVFWKFVWQLLPCMFIFQMFLQAEKKYGLLTKTILSRRRPLSCRNQSGLVSIW